MHAWQSLPGNYVRHIVSFENGQECKDDIDKLQHVLNYARDQIQRLAPSLEHARAGQNTEWRRRVGTLHLSTEVIRVLKSKFGVTMASIAWMKMMELLCRLNFGSRLQSDFSVKPFKTLHVCEAPGSFVASLRVHLSQQSLELLSKHEWVASTIMDDSSKMKMEAKEDFIQRTRENWVFGDLLLPETIQSIWTKLGPERSVQLATGDGSFNNDEDPNSQEDRVFYLLLAESIAQLGRLAVNGVFVLKIFTTFDALTQALCLFLSGFFTSFSLEKPPSSKATNSEQYIVAEGMRADKLPSEKELQEWLSWLSKPKSELAQILTHYHSFELDQLKHFLFHLKQAQTHLAKRQLASIYRTLYLPITDGRYEKMRYVQWYLKEIVKMRNIVFI